MPGDSSTIRFQALHPGVYVYHCMTPMVGQHVANGMYGMIVVEPPDGLPKVDREYYIMQGDFYLQGDRGQKGLRAFSLDKLFQEDPEYIVYNGSVGAMTGERALHANVGDTVRFFFGVGGPNKDSAFHVVGGSFDVLHPEGAAEWLTDVQTTLVPPGGATMAEMKLSVPGHYMIEDHGEIPPCDATRRPTHSRAPFFRASSLRPPCSWRSPSAAAPSCSWPMARQRDRRPPGSSRFETAAW